MYDHLLRWRLGILLSRDIFEGMLNTHRPYMMNNYKCYIIHLTHWYQLEKIIDQFCGLMNCWTLNLLKDPKTKYVFRAKNLI